MISVQQAADGFSAAGSAARLEVLKALVRAGSQGLSVGEIQKKLDSPASTVAHHLRTLSESGLIEQVKEGRTVVSRARFDFIAELGAYLLNECCIDSESNRCV